MILSCNNIKIIIMGFLSNDQKNELTSAGIEAGLQIFNDFRESSKRQREKDLEDNKIDISEYKRVCEELDEYRQALLTNKMTR